MCARFVRHTLARELAEAFSVDYRWTDEAHGAMQALTVELHYQPCKSGVGRPEKNE